ncbi:hypothetical protein TXIAM_380003 [Tenacibaculum xiamenense]
MTMLRSDNGMQPIPYSMSGKLWVVRKIESAGSTKFVLMNQKGEIVNDCAEGVNRVWTPEIRFKVARSGHRNLQSASMSSITTKVHPLVNENNTYRAELPKFENLSPNTTKIINASAVEYSDFWKPVNQNNNKYFVMDPTVYTNEQLGELNEDKLLEIYDNYNINPYVHNIRGNWKAKKSWAYLTGRYHSYEPNTRDDGYFTSFTPFYTYNNGWAINSQAINQYSPTKWTFASEVTQYAPQGVELENKDALNRRSSAQYGYKYTLPTAVASNTAYKELGYDGFEDYPSLQLSLAERGSVNHFSFVDAFSLENSSMVTDKEAHTGRKSIEVKPSKSVSLIKKLDDVNPDIVEDCEDGTVNPPLTDATINNITPINGAVCFGRTGVGKRFLITGSSNQTIRYNLKTVLGEYAELVSTTISVVDSETNAVIFDKYTISENTGEKEYNYNFTLGSSGKAYVEFSLCTGGCKTGPGDVLQDITVKGTFTLYKSDNTTLDYSQSVVSETSCDHIEGQ